MSKHTDEHVHCSHVGDLLVSRGHRKDSISCLDLETHVPSIYHLSDTVEVDIGTGSYGTRVSLHQQSVESGSPLDVVLNIFVKVR